MNFFKNAVFKREFLIFALIFLAFILHGARNLDPDFGWHLRAGELILSSGIPKTDPFSYTMPSFPFVDHEWLTDVILAKLYPMIGYFGLSVIFSLLAVLSLFVSKKIVSNQFRLKNNLIELSLFLLASAAVFPFFGVRPQVLSWLFLAVLLKILFNEGFWKKFFWLLPVFFVLWANLHGSFALGICTLFFVLFLRFFIKRKVVFKNLLVCLVCLAITLINPYGVNLWGEVFRSFSDQSLRFKIAEWTPAVLNINFPFMALVSLSFLIVFRYRKIISFEKISLYAVFLLAAISSQRHIPLWAILSLAITVWGMFYLFDEVKKIKGGEERFAKVAKFLFIGSLLLFVVQSLIFITPGSLAEKNFYPAKAVGYLRSNMTAGEVFSTYNWGGYLIWKLPGKKVFIDGRMPSWRRKKQLLDESSYAMADYEKILKGEIDFNQIAKKYNIDTILWPVGKKLNPLEVFWLKAERILFKKKNFDLLKTLPVAGWKKVYEDNLSVIYRQPE